MEDKIKGKHGFTLAELMIVIGIIAVLLGIALPIVDKAVEKSREAYDVFVMRQAASAAIELCYAGVCDSATAAQYGLKWWDNHNPNQDNAAGVYDVKTGKFLPKSSKDTKGMSYGKGKALDGGTSFTNGNPRGAYASNQDYTKAVVMVSIYPTGNNKRIDIYWKDYNGKYIGGQNGSNANDPRYSIRIQLD